MDFCQWRMPVQHFCFRCCSFQDRGLIGVRRWSCRSDWLNTEEICKWLIQCWECIYRNCPAFRRVSVWDRISCSCSPLFPISLIHWYYMNMDSVCPYCYLSPLIFCRWCIHLFWGWIPQDGRYMEMVWWYLDFICWGYFFINEI